MDDKTLRIACEMAGCPINGEFAQIPGGWPTHITHPCLLPYLMHKLEEQLGDVACVDVGVCPEIRICAALNVLRPE